MGFVDANPSDSFKNYSNFRMLIELVVSKDRRYKKLHQIMMKLS